MCWWGQVLRPLTRNHNSGLERQRCGKASTVIRPLPLSDTLCTQLAGSGTIYAPLYHLSLLQMCLALGAVGVSSQSWPHSLVFGAS